MDDLEVSQVEAEVDTEVTAEEEKVAEVKEKTETKSEDKRPSSVVKLLKQRNEAKQTIKELEAKVENNEALSNKVAELEEQFAKQTLDTESKVEKTEFFTKNPNAKEFEADIDKYAEKWLTYDQAFKLYAAETNPSLLMDEQYINKQTSTNAATWVTKELKADIENPESIKDFESNWDFFERSQRKARESRSASGLTN